MNSKNEKYLDRAPAGKPARPTKKSRILELWRKGDRDIWRLASDVESKPSYVASVLQREGLIQGYYDLYTSPAGPVNVYFGMFRGRLGYKNLEAAERSVALIEGAYSELKDMRDRAGQHHCLVVALTMYNRALFLGKRTEAEVFLRWLLRQFGDSLSSASAA